MTKYLDALFDYNLIINCYQFSMAFNNRTRVLVGIVMFKARLRKNKISSLIAERLLSLLNTTKISINIIEIRVNVKFYVYTFCGTSNDFMKAMKESVTTTWAQTRPRQVSEMKLLAKIFIDLKIFNFRLFF